MATRSVENVAPLCHARTPHPRAVTLPAAAASERGHAGGITHSIPDFRSVCAGGPLERCSVSRADVDVALAA